MALVLAAAFMHAGWNFASKHVDSGVPFIWLSALCASLIYTPILAVYLFIERPSLGWINVVFLLGAAILHTVYLLVLQKGYRVGALSVVYPLARGTGPLLATGAAIVLMGERPGPLALVGALCIGAGVFFIAGGTGNFSDTRARRGVMFALLTGVVIAAYTLWDKHSVSVLLTPPLLQDWASNFGRATVLAPLALRRGEEVRKVWRFHKRATLTVAVFMPLAYILVLTAMVFTPVSYVAPAREVSILIGTALGARLLTEGEVRRKLVAAAAIVAGVVLLAV